MKLSEKVKYGDMLTIYTRRGANWRCPVVSIDDDNNEITIDTKKLRNGFSIMTVEAKISKTGHVYGIR